MFGHVVRSWDPELGNTLASCAMPAEMLGGTWFVELLRPLLPTETMLSVWDVFFFARSPDALLLRSDATDVLIRAALAVLSLHRDDIIGSKDHSELRHVLSALPSRLFHVEMLLQVHEPPTPNAIHFVAH